MKDTTGTIIGIFAMLSWFLFALGGYVAGIHDQGIDQRREVQIQAVKAGYARWVVTDDGKTVFQWIPREVQK